MNFNIIDEKKKGMMWRELNKKMLKKYKFWLRVCFRMRKADDFFRKESQAWWCILLSFEKLESHSSVPESSWREIIKPLLCKLSLLHAVTVVWLALFHCRVSMYWCCFVLLFSFYLVNIWCLSCLSSLVSCYCCVPQRDICIVITPLGTCQRK